ncbi:sulfurtransferase [uncultured Tenacibaculum sp.]|uniref:sulfurtransferase n=1 Tax=uncultured Tenacibaculum sp. TaxID=174713 RepID=UPI002637281E|nr:sulfurtransferase [uncultured Tenacibaculum sp.]
MRLKIPTSLVSKEWLHENLQHENLIVLNATIQKVGTKKEEEIDKQQIPGTIFFDLKNVFLDKEAEYPNTIPSEKHFQREVQKLGINYNSCIVVYDDIGVYSSPRVWWLFNVFGFKNIAVLNGGLKEWISAGYKTEPPKQIERLEGNFEASFSKDLYASAEEVLKSLKKDVSILDARSKGRFNATSPEPREDLRGGHIPNSFSLPYSVLQEEGKMKPIEELKKLYIDSNPENKEMIFTCGSGITACILALGAQASGYTNYKVYDGSWTEWASRLELPIEK